jgi:hypothetical protein
MATSTDTEDLHQTREYGTVTSRPTIVDSSTQYDQLPTRDNSVQTKTTTSGDVSSSTTSLFGVREIGAQTTPTLPTPTISQGVQTNVVEEEITVPKIQEMNSAGSQTPPPTKSRKKCSLLR